MGHHATTGQAQHQQPQVHRILVRKQAHQKTTQRTHELLHQAGHRRSGTRHDRAGTLGQIMLPMLFERFPDMELPDPSAVIWKGFGFRGPVNLPVKLN